MKTIIYIIPGWGESCDEVRYKKLSFKLQSQGYRVKRIKPDWYQGLSANVFEPEKNSIVVGFSYGAVIAYLIAKKFTFNKVILCSLSPIHIWSYKRTLEEHLKYMNLELAAHNAKDIKSIIISLKNLKTPHILLEGQKERHAKIFPPDFLVPKTGHYISSEYITSISKLLIF